MNEEIAAWVRDYFTKQNKTKNLNPKENSNNGGDEIFFKVQVGCSTKEWKCQLRLLLILDNYDTIIDIEVSMDTIYGIWDFQFPKAPTAS